MHPEAAVRAGASRSSCQSSCLQKQLSGQLHPGTAVRSTMVPPCVRQVTIVVWGILKLIYHDSIKTPAFIIGFSHTLTTTQGHNTIDTAVANRFLSFSSMSTIRRRSDISVFWGPPATTHNYGGRISRNTSRLRTTLEVPLDSGLFAIPKPKKGKRGTWMT